MALADWRFETALHEAHHAGALFLARAADVTLTAVRTFPDGSGCTTFIPSFPDHDELITCLDHSFPPAIHKWFTALLVAALAPGDTPVEPGDLIYIENLCTAWDQARNAHEARAREHPPAKVMRENARHRAAIWRIRHATQCRNFARYLVRNGHFRGADLQQELVRHFGPSPASKD